jgi:hypothetical protein
MTDYIHHTNNVIDRAAGALPRVWKNISGLDKCLQASLRDKGWLPVVYENDAYDPATQVRTGPTGCNVGDSVPKDAESVTGTYSVRDKSAQELAAEEAQENKGAISQMSSAKAMWLLIEVIDKLLAQGTIQASDFTPGVKQAYQDLKAKVDSVKG